MSEEPREKMNQDDFYDIRTVRTVEFNEDDDGLIMTIHLTTYGKPKPADPTAGVAEEPPL